MNDKKNNLDKFDNIRFVSVILALVTLVLMFNKDAKGFLIGYILFSIVIIFLFIAVLSHALIKLYKRN